MDAYVLLILLALLGFLALVAIVPPPLYLSSQQEQNASRQWTPEAPARRHREAPPSPNGAPQPDTVEEAPRRPKKESAP